MYQALGRGITSDLQLTRLGRKIIGKDYIGTFPQDVKPSRIMTKRTPGNSYFILNQDLSKGPGIHWIACVYTGANFIIYDSFGRKSHKLLPHFVRTIGHRYIDINKDGDQPDSSEDCGQRSLAFLLFVKKYGAEAARHI
jgi:hypothetical protein